MFSVYLQGMYEYLINESQARGGNAISDAAAPQSEARRAARRGLRFGTAAWSVIDIADS